VCYGYIVRLSSLSSPLFPTPPSPPSPPLSDLSPPPSQGLSPADVIEGYEMALHKANQVLETQVVSTVEDVRRKECVLPPLQTALGSKQFGNEDIFAELVSEACCECVCGVCVCMLCVCGCGVFVCLCGGVGVGAGSGLCACVCGFVSWSVQCQFCLRMPRTSTWTMYEWPRSW